MRKTVLLLCSFLIVLSVLAQRKMETLDRGVVAVKTTTGVFVSWRIMGQEYYDTQYNIYRNGTKLNAEPLEVSNYKDAAGTTSSIYTIEPISRGVVQPKSAETTVWNNQYLSIPMGRVYSRNNVDVTSKYHINDASAADLDGDGHYEIIVKRINADDASFPQAGDAFCIFEAYKQDGTKLWTIDCGPNMISSGHVETNLVAFDWDQDGKAELLMQAADGTILGDGTVCGDINKNYRASWYADNMSYATQGDEFLVYMEGATGKPYSIREFPLKRLESGEASLNTAWGDGYGHRATKYFFGAPYLDGRNPSIFLARGIYTRHKMIAYDVNPETHELTQRWRWDMNTWGAWYGQGFHNYGIADVDLDGRDEIVYGSMVIDDNGRGLSTTGLGHGDAQHCGDLDPFRYGLEIYVCNENNPASTFYNATTGQIYYRYIHGNDCGRAMAANVTDQYFGTELIDARSGQVVSSVTDKSVQSGWSGMTMNFNIYWDGDLLQETFDYDSFSSSTGGGEGAVYKFGSGTPIFKTSGCLTNNWTKGTPCLQADLFGDWREEMVMRAADNMSVRIYTTTDVTPWRNYTLLHDMQYRQAIVWQMCGYNQPPHTSYFLGKAENITVAPPPVMTNGRVEIENSITSAHNNQHIILCNMNGGDVTVADGVSPYITTINAAKHIQGRQVNGSFTTVNTTYNLTGGAFTGAMRLVKQGEGTLTFSGNHTYTGSTDLWGGVTEFTGTLPNSAVNMNRFAELNAAGTLSQSVTMQYGAVLRAAGTEKGTLTVGALDLVYGAIVEFDIFSADLGADLVKVNGTLNLQKLTVNNGPKYNAPVFRMVQHNPAGQSTPTPGVYTLMEVGSVVGNLSEVIIDGLAGVKYELRQEGNQIKIEVMEMRDASTIFWRGVENSTWDLGTTQNFVDALERAELFVTGDTVVINDAAVSTSIALQESLSPGAVVVSNDSTSITITGSGSIDGAASVTKEGLSTLVIPGEHNYTGGTVVNGGTLRVATMPNAQLASSSIGAFKAGVILQLNNEAILNNTAAVRMGGNIRLGRATGDGGVINTSNTLTMEGTFTGYNLIKRGSGTLDLTGSANSHRKTIIEAGTIAISGEHNSQNGHLGDTVVFNGTSGTLQTCNSYGSYSSAPWHISVPAGKRGTITGDPRCDFTGRLVGSGTLTVHAVSNNSTPRCWFSGNWSAFEGTLIATTDGGDFQFANSSGLPKATLQIGAGVNVVSQKQNSSPTTYAFAIGQVTGSGNLGTSNRWTIGSDKDFTFDGTISAAPFTKTGTGQMTVTGFSTPSNVTISNGTLCLSKSGATTAMMGTGAMTVAANGALVGTGMLSNTTVAVTGLLRPGITETSISGNLAFDGKNVILNNGATAAFYISSRTMYTRLTDINQMTVRGATIKVAVRASYSPNAGDTFQLWNAESNTVDLSALKFDLEIPGPGYQWDTSEISEGILKVAIDTSIGDLTAGDMVECTVISLDGVIVDSFTTTSDRVQNELNDSYLNSGVYVVKIKKGSAKEVIQKMTKR